MGDKENAARVAWATVKLTDVGQRPVCPDRLAKQVGLPTEDTLRLLRLVWREQIDLRDDQVHLVFQPTGPRRYQVDADGHPIGSGKGCGVDMYLLALALGRPDLPPNVRRGGNLHPDLVHAVTHGPKR
jgi:hypothetical protein